MIDDFNKAIHYSKKQGVNPFILTIKTVSFTLQLLLVQFIWIVQDLDLLGVIKGKVLIVFIKNLIVLLQIPNGYIFSPKLWLPIFLSLPLVMHHYYFGYKVYMNLFHVGLLHLLLLGFDFQIVTDSFKMFGLIQQIIQGCSCKN